MKPRCLNCKSSCQISEPRHDVILAGSFVRRSDQARIQRYRCKNCLKSFSQATFLDCYYQKKREYNSQLFKLLASGFSQRRAALVLNLNRKTVVKKFIFLGAHSLKALSTLNSRYPVTGVFEFDDLETFEHTKCKPLSVIMAVESKSRRILGFRVAQMPAKGKLAAISRLKYGKRVDLRRPARNSLFSEISKYVDPKATIKSDENPHYVWDVKKHFPLAEHISYKGQRGASTGQGELKKIGFDPLFTLNHTFAMYRANINRLFRRTWNTTKIPERLSLHIAIYSLYHNELLIK